MGRIHRAKETEQAKLQLEQSKLSNETEQRKLETELEQSKLLNETEKRRIEANLEQTKLTLEQHKIDASVEERKITLELRRLDLQINTDGRRRDTEVRASSNDASDHAAVPEAPEAAEEPAAAVGSRGRKRRRRSTSRERSRVLSPPKTDADLVEKGRFVRRKDQRSLFAELCDQPSVVRP